MRALRRLLAALAFLSTITIGCEPVAAESTRNGAAALSAANAAVTVPINQAATCSTAISGTWSGTIAFEGSNGTGASWFAIGSESYAGGSLTTTTTASGLFASPVAGLTAFRARLSTATSGAATVVITCSPAVFW